MYKQDWRDSKTRDAKPTRPSPLPREDPSLYPVFIAYLESRSLDSGLAVKNGWFPTALDGVPRVVIPATSQTNTWPYYQARAMSDSGLRYRSPAVPRGDALILCYPHDERASRGVLIAEGPMDALAAAGLGYVGVGLMGNKPPTPVIHHIVSIIEVYADSDGTNCFIVPDADALSEAHALARTLWERGVKCYVKPLVGFKDLAGMPSAQRKLWF